MNDVSKSIGWAEKSWNPITGCLGPGGTPEKPNRCPYPCYAQRLANGRLKKLYLSNPNVAPGCDPDDPFSPRFWPERLDEPLNRKKPARIFVCDMSDLFHPMIPDRWITKVGTIACQTKQHIYQYLTKNPVRYQRPGTINWEWLGNEWLGITITNQVDWNERWSILAEINCAVKFVSFEPLLGPVRMGHGPLPDWIILGAQTNREKQPKPEWVSGLLWQARIATIPVFHKDNLDEEFIPDIGRLPRRQEWPNT